MYCDYKELENYAKKLNQVFNDIMNTMDSIETSYKSISSNMNWTSEVRNLFFDKTKQVFTNMENVNSKFFNVKLYLDTVVENYTRLDTNIGNMFEFKF